jgi:hypothetical protein
MIKLSHFILNFIRFFFFFTLTIFLEIYLNLLVQLFSLIAIHLYLSFNLIFYLFNSI